MNKDKKPNSETKLTEKNSHAEKTLKRFTEKQPENTN